MQLELGLVLEEQKGLGLKPLMASAELATKPTHFCSELVDLVVLEHSTVWNEVLTEVHLKESAKDFDS